MHPRGARRSTRALVAALALLGPTAVTGALWPGAGGAATTPRTSIVVTARKGLGRVSPLLFGANLLWPHGGGGAFDAPARRFYPAFLAMVRHLGVAAVRYPGGTTADSFHWKRAIGSAARRRPNEPYGMQSGRFPPRTPLVDGPVASVLGPNEYGALLDATGAIGDIVVNFATGTVQEAADFVAYMTAPVPPHPSSSPSEPGYWAALRAVHGHPAPYDVPYWEVGNEQQVPAEYGWRSGRLVALGPHDVACPRGATATCLYAFGGTTAFANQLVGSYANDLPSAGLSDGAPGQRFYAYYPPVVPRSERVEVGGAPWRPVTSLASAGRAAHVFAFDPANGEIRFGDGVHGAIPPAGAAIRISYDSGPHGGFVEFYRAMKRMDPSAKICESEARDLTLLRLLGDRHPYDCVVFHAYAAPRDVRAPLSAYEQELMAYPRKEAAALVRLQRSIARVSGRHVPVVVTEYGQTVEPMPAADPTFDLSLDEGLLIAAQLRQWIEHKVTLADKYLLTSSPFATAARARQPHLARRSHAGRPREWYPGLRIDSAMIAGPGPHPVLEPSGLVLGLMHRLAGTRLLASRVVGGPTLRPSGAPALLPIAATSHSGRLELLVANTSPSRAVAARLVLPGVRPRARLTASVLDGPSPTSFNTRARRNAVRVVTSSATLRPGRSWTFPAHSVTLLSFPAPGGAGSTGTTGGPGPLAPPAPRAP